MEGLGAGEGARHGGTVREGKVGTADSFGIDWEACAARGNGHHV